MPLIRLGSFVAIAASVLLGEIAAGQGVVNVYSARHYDTDDSIYDAFTEQTGIEVRLLEASSDQLLARLKSEGDLSPADVFITVDAGRLQRAVEEDLLQAVESDVLEERIPESLRHPENLWFGLTQRVRVIAASTERVGSDVQLNYEDLTNSEWNDLVLIRSSSNIYNQSLVASMLETLGEEETLNWCRGIVENLARTPQGGDRDQIRAVAAGEGDVAIVNHYYYVRMTEGSEEDQAAASKVRLIFPNQDGRGAHVNVCGAGVVATAPNKENAVRFIEFLTSDEAQQAFAHGNQEYPVVASVPPSEKLRELGVFKPDAVNASKLGENNAEAVRIMDKAGWR